MVKLIIQMRQNAYLWLYSPKDTVDEQNLGYYTRYYNIPREGRWSWILPYSWCLRRQQARM